MEIDGDSHSVTDAIGYDEQRQAFIESFGIRFLRFTNQQVHENLESVLEAISRAASAGAVDPPVVPPSQGGTGTSPLLTKEGI